MILQKKISPFPNFGRPEGKKIEFRTFQIIKHFSKQMENRQYALQTDFDGFD